MIVLTRAIMLGLIVFYAISTIPKSAIDLKNKIIISVIVVILYALIDYFAGFFTGLRNAMCTLMCGCVPPNGENKVDLNELSKKLDLDLPDLSDSSSSNDGFDDIDFGTASAVTTPLDIETISTDIGNVVKAIEYNNKQPEEELEEELLSDEKAADKATGAVAASDNESDAPVPADTEPFSNYASVW